MDFAYKTHVNEYGFYCVPDIYARREISKYLAQGKVYEPNTIRLLRRRVGQGDVIAGGAFIGDFLPAISSVLADNARLYTFEPNPISLEAANHTIALNGLRNVTLAQVALGAASGTAKLQVSTRQSGPAMAARAKLVEDDGTGDVLDVDVTTLDDMVPKSRKVTVLQLDIEGSEMPALEGARRIIEDSRPMIVLEAEKRWKAKMYLKFLNETFADQSYQMAGSMERNVFFLPSCADQDAR